MFFPRYGLKRPIKPPETAPSIPMYTRQRRGLDSRKDRQLDRQVDVGSNSKDVDASLIEEWINPVSQNTHQDQMLVESIESKNSVTKKYLIEGREKYITSSVEHTVYDTFLEKMRVKKYDESTRLETHHIVPKHSGGTDHQSNLIKLSQKDHTWAHLFRYFQYGEKGDCLAFLMR
jgi:hypothetical protein